MIAGVERQLVAQTRHLGPLGTGQILLVVGKQRAGVEQVVIQKVGIKFVAEVVMGGNVLPRLARVLRRVQWRRRATGLPSRRKPRSRRPSTSPLRARICSSAVSWWLSQSPSIQPRPPPAAAGQQTPVHLRRADPRLGAQRGGGVAKLKSLRPFAHGERAFAEAAQQTKEQPAREPHVARHIWFKRKDGIGHERSLLLTGWLYSGTRFSHSRSACQ